MAQLLDERDLGVLTSVMSLFVSLVSNNAEAYWNCLPKCVRILERLARNQDIPQEYTYYGIPSPWLQVLSFSCHRPFIQFDLSVELVQICF
jgi:AP-2 complex subunit alpha